MIRPAGNCQVIGARRLGVRRHVAALEHRDPAQRDGCSKARTCPRTPKFAVGIWRLAIITLLLSFPLVSRAALYNFTGPFNNNGAGNAPGVIPDNDPIGLADSHTISGLGSQIVNVTVTLNISGGWNGDLYAYLRLNDSPMVVLLDRVGVTSSNPDGYGDTGFQVTLSASASHDIHFYQNFSPSYNSDGQLTGTWQADGRTDPLSSTRGSLSAFNGLNPNGTWTIFFADESAGEQSTLVGWSLDITNVPELANVALLIFGALAAMRALGSVFGLQARKKLFASVVDRFKEMVRDLPDESASRAPDIG
ncbi:MAG: hypothetical protein C5B50_19470 [Verrucomicrobia bacterium]|nr:MAG: hypothetical protein C5B50_19470 [Verrucomicrobiota bacterium]